MAARLYYLGVRFGASDESTRKAINPNTHICMLGNSGTAAVLGTAMKPWNTPELSS